MTYAPISGCIVTAESLGQALAGKDPAGSLPDEEVIDRWIPPWTP
jgi:hypothetical protein